MISKFSTKKGPFSLLNNRNSGWYIGQLVVIRTENNDRQRQNKIGDVFEHFASIFTTPEERNRTKTARVISQPRPLLRIKVDFDGCELLTYQTFEQKTASTDTLVIVTVIDGQMEKTVHLQFTSLTGGHYELK